LIWNKSKEKKIKRADTKKQSTGFTMLLIPNSSDSARTYEITYDRLLQLFTGALATAIIVIGLLCSMMVYNRKLRNSLEDAESSIAQLNKTNTMLENTVSSLNRQIDEDKKAFSKIEDTISRREEEEAASAEEAAIPNSIPVKNATAILVEDPYKDSEGGETPGIVFSTTNGALVVAAAEGVVTHVDSDDDNPFYTRGVVIDHQNGYVTYYRMNGDVSANEGSTVKKNDVLGILTEDGFVAFEIKKDGSYVDPRTILKDN